MEPDATGYLSVAEQLAKGNINNSINGIWSPLGSLLLTPFIKLNFNEILSAKYLNGLYGFLSVAAFFCLLKRFKTNLSIATATMLGAILLILHFTFYRLFGDAGIIMFAIVPEYYLL